MANLYTPKFRVSYPNVFLAKKNALSGKEEFNLVAVFSKTADLSKLKAAMLDAITTKWGSDQKKWPTKRTDDGRVVSAIRSPFRKHEEKMYENDAGKLVYPPGMEEGGIFMNLKSSQKPGVVDGNAQPIIVAHEFYAGCYAHATVSVYAYEHAGNYGVSFGLQNIQKLEEGEALGSRTKAADDFAPIAAATNTAASANASANKSSADSIFG